VHFDGSGVNGGNDVMVDEGFKSSCALGQQSAVLDGPAAGLAMTSFYDAASTSSPCDVTQSNGVTSSFGFTQEQVACVCEVRAYMAVGLCIDRRHLTVHERNVE